MLVSDASGFVGTQVVKQLAGNGHSLRRGTAEPQLRYYMDLADAGARIAEVIDTGQVGAINICSGLRVSNRQFVESIADRYGRRDLLEFGIHQPHPRDPSAVVGVPNYVVEGSKRDARS